MSEYKYECPTEKGYVRFKISRKDQNRIFKYRKWSWSVNYDYYVKDNHIIMQRIPNVFGCLASTLLLPVGVLFEGLANTKETYRDMITKTWNAKKYGAFSGDDIYRRKDDDGTFDELICVSKNA